MQAYALHNDRMYHNCGADGFLFRHLVQAQIKNYG